MPFPDNYFPATFYPNRYWPTSGGTPAAVQGIGLDFKLPSRKLHYERTGDRPHYSQPARNMNYEVER